MKIELNPVDVLSRKIYDSHMDGANKISSIVPCTICRKRTKDDEGLRGHFHGSEFGQCMLKTYRDMTAGGNFEDPLDGKVDINNRAPFLLDGHAHEHSIVKNIEASGLTIVGFANQDEYEKIITVFVKEGKDSNDFMMPHNSVKVSKDFEETFKIIAHLDGLLEVTNKKTNKQIVVGLEVKSVKDYTWKKIKDTSEISDVWYGQVQCYMLHNHSIVRFYLIIKNRHTSLLMKPIRIDRDDKYINKRLNILYKIYNAILDDDPEKWGVVKEHSSPKDSECRFCPYKVDCYGNNLELKQRLKEEEEEE